MSKTFTCHNKECRFNKHCECQHHNPVLKSKNGGQRLSCTVFEPVNYKKETIKHLAEWLSNDRGFCVRNTTGLINYEFSCDLKDPSKENCENCWDNFLTNVFMKRG